MARSRIGGRQVPLHVRVKRTRAVDLRLSGVTYAEIAERIGYASAAGAQQAVEAALRDRLGESAVVLRGLDLARLDDLLRALWPQARAGDDKAVAAALRVMERRARYLGLDAGHPIEDEQREATPIDDLAERRAARRRAAEG